MNIIFFHRTIHHDKYYFRVRETVSTKYQIDLHSFDFNSDCYKKLEPREKLDLLTELKETRKASSWGRLHELPKKSQDFSDYQVNL